MSNFRYLAGYIIRLALGTALVLCVISAVRIIKFKNKIEDPKRPDGSETVWVQSLVYPDKAVNFVLEKYAPGLLPPDAEDAESDVSPERNDAGETENTYSGPVVKVTPQPYKKKPRSHKPDLSGMPVMPDAADTADSGSRTPPSPKMPAGSGEWGLTINHSTPVYSLKGKKLGNLPAAKAINVLEHKQTSKGEMLICTIVGKSPKKIVIRRSDIISYNCDINAVSEEQRSLCLQQAKILGAISARESQLKKAAAGNNPYAAEYKRSLANYKKFAKRNNRLLEEYNNSTGARRMQVADELRLIKEKSARVTDSFHEIKMKYKNWKDNHQSSAPDFDRDPQIKNLKRRLAAVEHKLANP